MTKHGPVLRVNGKVREFKNILTINDKKNACYIEPFIKYHFTIFLVIVQEFSNEFSFLATLKVNIYFSKTVMEKI